MNRHARPKQYFTAPPRAPLAAAHTIEWEELPSLQGSLAQRLVQRGIWRHDVAQRHGANDADFVASAPFGTPWDNTVPAALDPLPLPLPPAPRQRQTSVGRATRELADTSPLKQLSFDFDPLLR